MTTQVESKIVATHRLRREGVWEDARWFREQERQRLRAEGMGRRETKEEAWRLMFEDPPMTAR